MELTTQENLKSEYGKARSISLRVVGSIVVLGVTVFLIRYVLAPFEGFVRLYAELSSTVVGLLRIVFFVLGVGAFGIWSLLLIPNLKRHMLSSHDNEPPIGTSAIEYLTVANFGTMMLCVFPACCGFLLYCMFGQLMDFYLLAGLSLILIVLRFPRYGIWKLLLTQDSLRQE